MSCDAKLLLAPPWRRPDQQPWIITCTQHQDTGKHAGKADHNPYGDTLFLWLEDDRRNFRGDLAMCPAGSSDPKLGGVGRCTLPAGHHGRHAT